MRIPALAALALGLSACGGGDRTPQDANALDATDNMTTDPNLMMDANSINGTAGMDANGSVDAATQNLMEKDAATNDADTNLANGL